MVRWLWVIVVVGVCAGSADSGLVPMKRRAITKADLESKGGLGRGELKTLSDNISKYLLYFEDFRQRGTNDYIKQAMHVVKLLIAQSWISTLEPEKVLLTIQTENVQQIKKSVVNALMETEEKSPHKVSDYILYYVDTLEPYIANELVSQKNSMKYARQVFFGNEEVEKGADDDQTATLREDTWKGILDVLDEIRSNFIIHKITTRMLLQSYITNFIPESERPKENKFILTSTDNKIQREFDYPDLGLGIYMDIMEISNEVDKDMSDNVVIKDELYIHILNQRIKEYLESFHKIIEEENITNKKTMLTIKQLMIQGWIETMKPGQEFFPTKEPDTLESTRQNIIKGLRKTNQDSPVGDAVLLYINEKEEQIEKDFKSRNDTYATEYREKMKVVKNIKEIPENKDELSKLKKELKEIERKINIENDNLVAHKICKLFYLNSYREDFMPRYQTTTIFKIEPSIYLRNTYKGQEFNIPAVIDIKQFFSDFIKMDLEK